MNVAALTKSAISRAQKEWWRYALWSVFWALLLGPMILMAFMGDPADKKRLETLRRIVAETPLHPDFKEVGSRSELSKNTGAIIIIGYRGAPYATTYDDVKNFYVRELPLKGWNLTADDGETRQLTFRRGEYKIVIQPEVTSTADYVVDYMWDRP